VHAIAACFESDEVAYYCSRFGKCSIWKQDGGGWKNAREMEFSGAPDCLASMSGSNSRRQHRCVLALPSELSFEVPSPCLVGNRISCRCI